jgi:hypothetical protein
MPDGSPTVRPMVNAPKAGTTGSLDASIRQSLQDPSPHTVGPGQRAHRWVGGQTAQPIATDSQDRATRQTSSEPTPRVTEAVADQSGALAQDLLLRPHYGGALLRRRSGPMGLASAVGPSVLSSRSQSRSSAQSLQSTTSNAWSPRKMPKRAPISRPPQPPRTPIVLAKFPGEETRSTAGTRTSRAVTLGRVTHPRSGLGPRYGSSPEPTPGPRPSPGSRPNSRIEPTSRSGSGLESRPGPSSESRPTPKPRQKPSHSQ